MLIRVVCAIKEKKLHADLENKLSNFDVQLKMLKNNNAQWQELVRSCGDLFLVSKSLAQGKEQVLHHVEKNTLK